MTCCGACTATNQAHGFASHQVQDPWTAPAGAGSITPWTCSAVRWVCRPLLPATHVLQLNLLPTILLSNGVYYCWVSIEHNWPEKIRELERLEQRHLTSAGLVLCSFVAPGSACRSHPLCHQRKSQRYAVLKIRPAFGTTLTKITHCEVLLKHH